MKTKYTISPRCLIDGVMHYSIYESVEGKKGKRVGDYCSYVLAEKAKKTLEGNNSKQSYMAGNGAAVVVIE